MPSDDFDRLCHRLIRLEHPQVEKPSTSGDGGADALLPKDGGGYARAWQVKHFPKRIRWDQCLKSFRDARDNYAPDRYTFCFPHNLSKTEQKTFDGHFRGGSPGIPVDFWGDDEIQARLTETPEGRTIARQFFRDNDQAIEEIKRMVEAGGRLDAPQDALKRMRPIGEYLAAGDSYFTYAGSTYREGAATEPPDGTVMSVYESGDGITTRIDAVPNDAEAMELHAPRGTLRLSAEVYDEAAKALARGEGVTFEGIDVTWDQLPPAFGDPSLPTSRETPMIRELPNPEGANGARDVVDEHERSHRPRSAASRRRAQ